MRTRKLQTGNRNLVGQALFKIRNEQNLRSKDVVKALNAAGSNINCSSLSKIEGGHKQITDFELLSLSIVYNVSANDIYKMALNVSPKEREQW